MKKTKHKNKAKKANHKVEDSNYGKLELPKRSYKIRDKSELIHSNPFQVSESIVKSLIDKIIVFSVRESYMKGLNKVFENYYNKYVFKQLNSLFATNYLFYYDEPESENRNNMFWNKSFNSKNTWIEITEPNSSKIDRYENIFMKYINYVPPSTNSDRKKNVINRANTFKEENTTFKNKKELIDIKMKTNSNKKFSLKIKNVLNKEGQNNILDILEEKSSISSKDEETKEKKPKRISRLSKSIDNPLHNIRKSLKKSLSPRKDPSKNSKSPLSQNDLNTEIDNDNKNENNFIINKNSKKQPILAMNFKEIPGIEKEFDFDKYLPPDVEELRKEIEEEKIRKEKEEKKKVIINKITINNNENAENNENKLKIIDSNKLTFDSNGKIINFKPIKIETLSKDFASLKDGIKALDININLKKTTTRKNRINRSKETPKIKNSIKKEKEIITKNPEDDPNGVNKFNFVKVATERTEQIIPSGSNFSIMLPNIGVTLKEDDKIKEGTREFGRYFKKYSISDYDKILRDYLPIQNKTMLKNKIGHSQYNTTTNMNLTSVLKKIPKNVLNTNTSYKYNSTNSIENNNTININTNTLPLTQTQNFNTELTNPLINPQETIQENDTNTNIKNNSFIKTNKSNISYVFSGNNLYTMSKLNNISNFSEEGLIKLNRNCSSSSLKNEIENIKDLNNGSKFNFYPPKIELKTRNIFENNYEEFYKIKRNKEIKENINIGKNINELNKKIIMNGGWGNHSLTKNNSTGNLLFSKHATKYQALKELGSNLLNGIKVKLPRERKVDIHI